MSWQPIDTAPRDGTTVDVWCQYSDGSSGRIVDCCFKDGRWVRLVGTRDAYWINYIVPPTHWQPLPPPPEGV